MLIAWISTTLYELLIPSFCNLRTQLQIKLRAFNSNKLAQRHYCAFAGCSDTLQLLSKTSWEKSTRLLHELRNLKKHKHNKAPSSAFFRNIQIQLRRQIADFHVPNTETATTFTEFYCQQDSLISASQRGTQTRISLFSYRNSRNAQRLLEAAERITLETREMPHNCY